MIGISLRRSKTVLGCKTEEEEEKEEEEGEGGDCSIVFI
jgi:hypothetical protein